MTHHPGRRDAQDFQFSLPLENIRASGKRAFQILFSAVLLSAVIGCAGNAHKESTGEYVDDSWITSKVKAAFVKDGKLKSSEINVETYKGTVQLSGFVADASDVKHAADVAVGIKGVTSVRNDIQVK